MKLNVKSNCTLFSATRFLAVLNSNHTIVLTNIFDAKDKVLPVRDNESQHEGVRKKLGNKWKLKDSVMSRPFYPKGKIPRYTLDRRLSGPQRRSGHCEEEKYLALPAM
jgi:hypothetical protein